MYSVWYLDDTYDVDSTCLYTGNTVDDCWDFINKNFPNDTDLFILNDDGIIVDAV